jgi:hypothetical protein
MLHTGIPYNWEAETKREEKEEDAEKERKKKLS